MEPRSRQSGIKMALLRVALRMGRITRHLPRVRAFYHLRDLYRKILPAGFLIRTEIEPGLVLDLDLTGNLGLFLWHYPDFYEKEEIAAFCSFVKPGSIVLDVGANAGLYTLLAAKRGATVFAIEADPRNAAMLRHHIRLNGVSNQVTVLEMAATGTEKTVSLYRNPLNEGESNIIERGEPAGTIAGRTIDSLNLPPVNICKMDIEGAEFDALTGMEQTLKRSAGLKLFVEYAEAFGNAKPLLDFLRSNFTRLKVLESPQMDAMKEVLPFCNILAER